MSIINPLGSRHIKKKYENFLWFANSSSMVSSLFSSVVSNIIPAGPERWLFKTAVLCSWILLPDAAILNVNICNQCQIWGLEISLFNIWWCILCSYRITLTLIITHWCQAFGIGEVNCWLLQAFDVIFTIHFCIFILRLFILSVQNHKKKKIHFCHFSL